ncbi:MULTISPECIES: energy-coupling factor ABC transporter ATP-binding protein [Clostridium]|uniref:ABC transporter ATP-binding protein n=3 Tax=Clostridium TaxID=1485 RepID=A0A166THV2_9CLOT|nr:MULTISPECIES: ATP-binding cassette domain-containing protein [Clostridium]AGY75081.1 ATP-binding cassette domain-containing protein [Clostridium autoethanogenum DSM 10061]ALU35253.1 Cobalt ABC transporter ATPase subunit [Clostridium autoethanogenum DSM 10061]OAA93708.1 Energy-coupling factor transporter ATP-binding protein EcfA3 [Clostridium coskatii]OBR95998.1 energy-coupling factor transporter ATP-binding protein EcfA3 [Clostridium coskatii]OVY49668.1 Energy-coupling factor transporter AT
MEIIDVSQVSYAYGDGSMALKDINMKIKSGEKVAILGPNGAGKSTLFHLFNGILKPTSGTITVNGMEVCKKNLVEIRRNVGMVFQDSDDQLFNPTVRQEIAYGLLNMGVSGKKLENTIEWALKTVGMSGYEDKSPHNLSGGQKKRIALASVLAMKPKVMVLDEPTAALDPRGVHKLIRLLDSINKELGITLIFATHDVDTVPLLADKVYLLDKGKVVMGGTTEEVFNQKEVIRKINLRLPRVAHLIEILDRDGILNADDLPLTIGQAKDFLEKNKSQV